MIERMLRGLAAVATVVVVWWAAFGLTSVLAMTDPDVVEVEGRARIGSLAGALGSPSEALDFITYWGLSWLFQSLATLAVAAVLAIVGATARSRSADRTPVVVGAKALLTMGTAALVFLVGASNAAYGLTAPIPWPDWAAAALVAAVAALAVWLGVRPMPRRRPLAVA